MGAKVRAIVTSIGEPTTELCIWSLERQGFQVDLYQDKSTLWDKLNRIYKDIHEDFIRVDADVVVNQNIKELITQTDLIWYQSLCYGWFSQDIIHGGVQFVRKAAIEPIRKHIHEASRLHRPESYLFRLEEFHNPRVCGTFEKICGIHGYKQNDWQRIKQVKQERGQMDNYDFELAEKLEAL